MLPRLTNPRLVTSALALVLVLASALRARETVTERAVPAAPDAALAHLPLKIGFDPGTGNLLVARNAGNLETGQAEFLQ